MDLFKDSPVTLTSPATSGSSVAPDDNTPLAHVSRALYVGQTGDISVELQNGENLTLANVQAGSVLAIRCLKVRATGTTAGNIVSLW